MGLSLRNIGKKLFDEVNPFDNGKTWSNDNTPVNAPPAPVQRPQVTFNQPQIQTQFQNPNPVNPFTNPTPTTPHASFFHDLTHNPVTNAVGDVAKPVVQFAKPLIQQDVSMVKSVPDVIHAPVNVGRVAVAKLTDNQKAAQQPTQQLKSVGNTAAGFAQFVPRAGIQTGETIGQAITSKNLNPLTFNKGLGKVVFGNQPIPSLQQNYQSEKQKNGSAYAAGSTALSGAMDVLAALGAKKGVTDVTAKKGVTDVTGEPLPLDEVGGRNPVIPKPTPDKSTEEPFVPTIKQPFQPTEPTALPEAPTSKPKVSPKTNVVKSSITKPTSTDLAMGDALGMTPEQVAKQVATGGTDVNSMLTASGHTAQDLADLPPEQQMAILNNGKTQTGTPEMNAKFNPYKSKVMEVQPGEYGKVIANSQLVDRPLKLAKDTWVASMKKLTPEETTNFWRAVEDPSYSTNSPQITEALTRWRTADNMAHGNFLGVGKNSGYIVNHGLHPWILKDGGLKGVTDISRKYRTIAEGEQKGLTLGTDPITEGGNYLDFTAAQLRKTALKKGFEAADAGETVKPRTLDLGHGTTVNLSAKGYKEARGVQYDPASDNPFIKSPRTANKTLKSSLLSASQFHTINVAALRAAPTLAIPKPSLLMKGDLTMGSHPIRAIKAVAGPIRVAFKGGENVVDQMKAKAVADGTADKAAMIGSPYGTEGFAKEGTFNHGAVGEHLVFGKQMAMTHDQVVRGVISDLERNNIPLDSPEARTAGKAANNTMAFVNTEVQKISPKVRRSISDWFLAGQFTPSKFSQLRTAVTKGGVGGAYGRANMVANVAATTTVIVGVGYLLHQKSDSVRDMVLRALVDPAVPTPSKDAKGNTVKLRLPGTDTSDFAKLLGIKLVRNPDGHLGVSWKPQNLPQTLQDFARSRLSPLVSAAVKVRSNTTFASKPLYDPNAPMGTKVEQAVTSLVTGSLPIGLQGLAYTSAVKNHVPGAIKEVLDAQTPGNNPVVKSIGSSFGLTPSTDVTTGKGLQTAQYFDAVAKSGSGLDRQSHDAFDMWTGSKKNPVTGKYDIMPSAYDSATKANVLLQNPKAFDAVYNLNQQLAKLGQNVDPLWKLPQSQVKSYLDYSHMPAGGPDRTDWVNKNPWYYGDPTNPNDKGLAGQRTDFFNSLPVSDPNKPKLDLTYPTPTPQIQSVMDQYSNITDSTQKGAFLDAHPELIQQWNKQSQYTNDFRKETGYSPLKLYPEATPDVQKYMTQYTNADKSTRAGMRNANPQMYQKMVGYFDSVDLYNINKQGGVSQLQGEPDYTSNSAKAMSNIAKDIYQNSDGSYAVIPAGWMNGLSNGSGGGSSYKKRYRVGSSVIRARKGKKVGGRVSIKKGTRMTVASKNSSPAVSIKSSMV